MKAKECDGRWGCLRLDFSLGVCASLAFSINLLNTVISELLLVVVCNTQNHPVLTYEDIV